MLATTALLELADESEQQALLPALVAGERIATLAWVERGGVWAASASSVVATADGDRVRLNGHKKYVLDGLAADLLLVVARAAGGERQQPPLSLLVAQASALLTINLK